MTITRKFRSVAWAAAVASAALSCYLISHRVSAERNALEDVERDIQIAREEILSLNTEFQTRSRMSQIEVWNRRDFILVAPDAAQFLEGEFALASLIEGPQTPSPVRQASATDDASDPSDDRQIDEDVFEAPDADDIPHIQQASYVVPDDIAASARGRRISFLDARLRGDIAGRAAAEQREEDDADR
jgi:hypothetical protein